jgi:glycine cleavage system H protein
MNNSPNDLYYTRTHEWVKLDNKTIIRVGISDFAQTELGDLVYIELPEVGKHVEIGKKCAVVESVKAAADLYAPLTGIICEVNHAIIEEPELLNDEPYQHWLFCIKVNNIDNLTSLMNADQYQKFTEYS